MGVVFDLITLFGTGVPFAVLRPQADRKPLNYRSDVLIEWSSSVLAFLG